MLNTAIFVLDNKEMFSTQDLTQGRWFEQRGHQERDGNIATRLSWRPEWVPMSTNQVEEQSPF